MHLDLRDLVILIVVYFIPTILGAILRVRGLGVLLLTNLLIGWTAFGWIAVLFQVLFYRKGFRIDPTLTPREHRALGPDPALARPKSLYPDLHGLD